MFAVLEILISVREDQDELSLDTFHIFVSAPIYFDLSAALRETRSFIFRGSDLVYDSEKNNNSFAETGEPMNYWALLR